MKYDFQINGQTFGDSDRDPVVGKSFIDSHALGFDWRPGAPLESGLVSECKIDGSNFSRGLSLSFVYDMIFRDCEIVGGRDSCLSIVRGGRVTFERCQFISRGKTGSHVSIRGGAKDVCFKDCTFVGNYKSLFFGSCINLGGWSVYDSVPRPFVRQVKILGCEIREVTKGTFCRVLYSEFPSVINSPGKISGIPRFLVNTFWFLKRRGLLGGGIKLPEKLLGVHEVEL
jgi:hypothetical protein